jgi:monovalent cation/proton antiporter MnhG/PhaG subunit
MKTAAIAVLLVAGVGLQLVACLGIVLLRDVLDRLHYTATGGVAGVCLAAAVVVDEGPSLIGIKAVLLAAFLVVVSPVLAHVTARAIEAGP